MSDNPLGKIDRAVFDASIRQRLGHPDPAVLIGPKHGVDAAILDMGEEVLAVTTDPFFIVPDYGWQRAGWFAVHILASDVATSGLPPRFLSVDLNLPPSMSNEDLDEMWSAVHDACEKLKVSIVTG
ncbi:MAG: AIR synthase related protein, partial [Myxococcota bacterium]